MVRPESSAAPGSRTSPLALALSGLLPALILGGALTGATAAPVLMAEAQAALPAAAAPALEDPAR